MACFYILYSSPDKQGSNYNCFGVANFVDSDQLDSHELADLDQHCLSEISMKCRKINLRDNG